MGSDLVIHADGLGKKYVIDHESEREQYTALRDVIGRSARNFVRRTADILRGRPMFTGDTTEEFWALKDVNLEIKRGEVVGIIGRNGAGKSTLLKILSRITEPTEGCVTIRGRIGSLLEVGTGFHPELTGRENIYLNGAILGMQRAEIRRKFDEIVAFAEVEKFLDTPVKRYSSGMHVRLAFAVAAHLEPEILLVDEVLAVGDAEFQRKSIGKISDVANMGRTVFFVSHNLGAIRSLCTHAFLFDHGKLTFGGDVSGALAAYERVFRNVQGLVASAKFYGPIADQIRIDQIIFRQGGAVVEVLNPLRQVEIELQCFALRPFPTFELKISLFRDGLLIGSCHDTVAEVPLRAGHFISRFTIPANIFRSGMYTLGIGGRETITSWVWGSDVAALHFSENSEKGSADRYEGVIGLPYTAQRIQQNVGAVQKAAL
jgi:ABC-type polysaccharide/polyol phosphate transport system ATPase subunit